MQGLPRLNYNHKVNNYNHNITIMAQLNINDLTTTQLKTFTCAGSLPDGSILLFSERNSKAFKSCSDYLNGIGYGFTNIGAGNMINDSPDAVRSDLNTILLKIVNKLKVLYPDQKIESTGAIYIEGLYTGDNA